MIKPTSKNLLVSLFMLFLINSCKKCDDPIIYNCSHNEPVFQVVEQMPQFPGGIDSLNAFINTNLIYPEKSKQNKIEGVVTISFIVNKFGNIECVKILESENDEFENESKRLINIMPLWSPGKHNGRELAVSIALQVVFKL